MVRREWVAIRISKLYQDVYVNLKQGCGVVNTHTYIYTET